MNGIFMIFHDLSNMDNMEYFEEAPDHNLEDLLSFFFDWGGGGGGGGGGGRVFRGFSNITEKPIDILS